MSFDEKNYEEGSSTTSEQREHLLPSPSRTSTSSPSPPSSSRNEDNSLPSPAMQKDTKTSRFGAAAIIPIWIVLSASVIIYNNHIYANYDFPYPIFLVTWHLAFAATGTRLLHRFTHLLDAVNDIHISKDMFLRSILPIGALFSGSLILSNTAYLYLSVAYIQMLKSFNPVAILLISWSFNLSEPNKKLAVIVSMISSGVALASRGEMHFNIVGFLIQGAAVGFEACRLTLIQVLLHGLKMDPLVSLHYYAPVCAILNLCILPLTEGLAPFYALRNLGPFVLASNAAIAFALNVSAVFLVGRGSGLILTLSGIFKDILLISGSVILFGASVSPMQVIGYGIALVGLVFFKQAGGK